MSAPGRFRRAGRWRARARSLGSLSWAHWRALVHALLWIPATRAALAVLPWRWVSGAFDRSRVRPGPPDWARARASVWAINAVARRVLPRRPCLTQALVGRRALRRFGVETDLRIGAVRDDGGAFTAHAWIERDGVVVLGENGRLPQYARFTPLADRAASRAAPEGPTVPLPVSGG